eukprot:762587-Hanusia_phi.AAC.2
MEKRVNGLSLPSSHQACRGTEPKFARCTAHAQGHERKKAIPGESHCGFGLQIRCKSDVSGQSF